MPIQPFRLLPVLLVLTLLGCQNEDIERYKVPKPESLPRVELPTPQGPPQLLLAAIAPHGERTWFFKVVGAPEDVTPLKEPFETFLRSVRFNDKGEQPITWTVPKDWQEERGSGMRHATFRIGPKGLELTVIPLGKEFGSILDNINRWRGQIGLRPITQGDLPTVSREFKWDGGSGLVVEMTGVDAGKAGKMPPFAGKAAAPPAPKPQAARPPFRYELPSGWKEGTPTNSLIVAAFDVPDGGKFTVVPLAGQGGSLLGNVNRWRSQVGLPSIKEEEMQKELKYLQVSGQKAPYVEIKGRESLLIVAVPLDGQTWFFKLQGPAEVVAKQKPTFEAFLASIRFE